MVSEAVRGIWVCEDSENSDEIAEKWKPLSGCSIPLIAGDLVVEVEIR